MGINILVLSLESTKNAGRNNISLPLEDFKIGHKSLIPFYFGYILNHRTKALKKKKKGSFGKTRGKSTARSKYISSQREKGWGGLLGSMEATTPSPLALWCVPALVLGMRALHPVERQTVLLAPTCSLGQSPGRSWPCGVPVILPTHGTLGTLLRGMLAQILHEKSPPSHSLPCQGWAEGNPFCQILWCLCTSPGEGRERKESKWFNFTK